MAEIKTWTEMLPVRLPETMIDCAMMQITCMAQEIDELRAALVERVPLSDGQIGAALKAACLRDTPESRKDMERAIRAAHNIKES